MRRALHPLMRLRGLGERKDRIDDRFAPPGLEERPYPDPQVVGDHPLFRRRTRAERQAGVDKALLHERPQVDRRFLALQVGDLHDPPSTAAAA